MELEWLIPVFKFRSRTVGDGFLGLLGGVGGCILFRLSEMSRPYLLKAAPFLGPGFWCLRKGENYLSTRIHDFHATFTSSL